MQEQSELIVEMPNDEKQKKQKVPSRKARGVQGKATRRSEGHSDLVVEQFIKGKKPDLFIAKVTKAHGGRFDLEDDAHGVYVSVALKGNLKLTRKAARNPAVKTAIDTGDDVLTDGGQIHAALQPHEAKHIRRMKIGKITGVESLGKSRSSNMNGFSFNRESVKNEGLSERAATRKAAHKKAGRTPSGSPKAEAANMAGLNANVGLPAGSPEEANNASGERLGRYSYKGKKVFSVATGREVHGEEKREAKRALEAKKKRATGGK